MLRFVFSVVGLFCFTGVASAHITLLEPRPRTSAQKDGPCGAVGSGRGDRVTVLRPGEVIAVSWDETVDHASHYRVAFDDDGDDGFVPPAGRDDLYNSESVLVDGIGDEVGGRYVQMVTLPNIECERCTLQLIQVMYGSGNYFQCADLALRADGTTPPPADDAGGAPSPGSPRDGAPGVAGGCTVARRGSAGSGPLVGLALLLAWSRRRPAMERR